MSKFYLAPDRKGNLTKVVEDVEIPSMKVGQSKLSGMGRNVVVTRQALVARFSNEGLAKRFLDAYNAQERNNNET